MVNKLNIELHKLCCQLHPVAVSLLHVAGEWREVRIQVLQDAGRSAHPQADVAPGDPELPRIRAPLHQLCHRLHPAKGTYDVTDPQLRHQPHPAKGTCDVTDSQLRHRLHPAKYM